MERPCKEQKQIKQYHPVKLDDQFLPNPYAQISVFLLFIVLLITKPISVEFVNLQPGYNLFSLPVEPSNDATCNELKTRLGANQIIRLDIQTQIFENCNENEVDFPITPGIGYVLESPTTGDVNFSGVLSLILHNNSTLILILSLVKATLSLPISNDFFTPALKNKSSIAKCSSSLCLPYLSNKLQQWDELL